MFRCRKSQYDFEIFMCKNLECDSEFIGVMEKSSQSKYSTIFHRFCCYNNVDQPQHWCLFFFRISFSHASPLSNCYIPFHFYVFTFLVQNHKKYISTEIKVVIENNSYLMCFTVYCELQTYVHNFQNLIKNLGNSMPSTCICLCTLKFILVDS